MCNKLHSDAKSIPKEGKAWKLVLRGKALKTLTCRDEYEISDDGWMRYDKLYAGGDGFCALPTRAEARRAKESWNRAAPGRARIIKIQYSGGKGEHIEYGFTGGIGFRTIIIGAFKPI